MTTPDPSNPYAAPAAPPPPPGGQGWGAPAAPPAPPTGGQGWGGPAAPPVPPPGAQGWGGAPQAPAGQGWPGGIPPVKPPAGPKNLPVAVLAGLGVALASGLLYGFIAKAIDHEISWMVIGIAAAVGVTVGKIGGKHPVLPPVGSLLALGGLFFGEMFGISLVVHEKVGIPVTTMMTEHFDLLFEGWKETFDLYSVLFIGLGVVVGFNLTRKFGES